MDTRPNSGATMLASATMSEQPLWANRPVLPASHGEFAGRVFAEVWADGTTRVVTTDRSLIRLAGSALQNASPILANQAVGPTSPVTGRHGSTDFLGRVIIEVWSGGAAVAFMGSDEHATRQHAIKRLQELS